MRNLNLDGYEPRYDPTVIPIEESAASVSATITTLNLTYNPNLTTKDRHYSINDYHSAYKAGSVTPTAVAEALLDLISKHPQHKDAFLEIHKERVIAAADASTQRYKAGKALGMFDGVPVGVKGKSLPFAHEKVGIFSPFLPWHLSGARLSLFIALFSFVNVIG